jgi:hypothetical protein
MRRAVSLTIGLAVMGCRDQEGGIRAAPERELPPSPAPPPSIEKLVSSLMGHAGEEVTIEGVSDPSARPRIPWSVHGKSPLLIALSGTGLHVVAHVTEVPSCASTILLTGQVIVARGMIRQGATEGAYAEPQLDVTRWSCR